MNFPVVDWIFNCNNFNSMETDPIWFSGFFYTCVKVFVNHWMPHIYNTIYNYSVIVTGSTHKIVHPSANVSLSKEIKLLIPTQHNKSILRQ